MRLLQNIHMAPHTLNTHFFLISYLEVLDMYKQRGQSISET